MKRLVGVLAAMVLSAGLASAQDIVEYVHLDALGSVRAVSNQANVVIERHDYLPFGEECTTGPCTANPGAGAGQPRKFTGKERDQETGLDYFEARYYGSRIGRFTTVDPLRVVGTLVDPQQWNRYAYARNNPLRYLDPHGLYVFDPSASQAERDAFSRGLESAGRASTSGRLSDLEQDSVGHALDAYGAPDDDNGVTVRFGKLKDRAGTTEARGLNSTTLLGDIVVTLDLGQLAGNDLAIAISHEGSHVADAQSFYTALVADPAGRRGTSSVIGGLSDRTHYISGEVVAYRVSALTALGLGLSNYPIGGHRILDSGRVDMGAIRVFLRDSPLYGLSEARQGPRQSGR